MAIGYGSDGHPRINAADTSHRGLGASAQRTRTGCESPAPVAGPSFTSVVPAASGDSGATADGGRGSHTFAGSGGENRPSNEALRSLVGDARRAWRSPGLAFLYAIWQSQESKAEAERENLRVVQEQLILDKRWYEEDKDWNETLIAQQAEIITRQRLVEQRIESLEYETRDVERELVRLGKELSDHTGRHAIRDLDGRHPE